MIEAYIQQIDELLSACDGVVDVIVLRRNHWQTDWEKVLNYRYRVILADGGLIEMTERVLEIGGRLEVTKYRHHWQDANKNLIKRWDNAPHHRQVETFPHHLHDSSEENVVAHAPVTGLAVLQYILTDF
jgi:hypothetical protein